MTPTVDRFRRIDEIFQSARRLEGASRAALLEVECADDPELQREVESLLAVHDKDESSFLADVALGGRINVEELDTLTDAPLPLPKRIGRYTIIRLLGEGGMGIVYLAEQDRTKQRVALKIMRSGLVTQRMLNRFDREAQLLGCLRHPGIARVYEAGVQEDRSGRYPFIAMEYVEGPSIINYLREQQPGLEATLALFVRVCDAVNHAHQKGIIHRDLKPGNILVEESEATGTGHSSSGDTTSFGLSSMVQPKILDFGIARATDIDIHVATVQTNVGQLLGTIQYMSPEQTTGDPNDLDIRSDIYALGVLLYEMLTDRLPYDTGRGMIHEAVRVIQEVDPAPLSAIKPSLRGDLETIVTKALEKDRDRRYQTAFDLGAEIVRFINREPILAHPPSAMYQFRKFTQRNRGIVATTISIAILLIVGITGTTWMAILAGNARDAEAVQRVRAEQRFNDLRQLANEFLFGIDTQLENLSGSLPARRQLVETGLTYLDRLASEADDDPALTQELASSYIKLGDIQGLPSVSNLGNTAGALRSFEKAARLLESIGARDSVETADKLYYAYSKYAEVAYASNDIDAAFTHCEMAMGLAQLLREHFPDNYKPFYYYAHSLNQLAEFQRLRGDLAEASETLQREIEVRREIASRFDESVKDRRNRSLSHFTFGLIALQRGEAQLALDSFETFIIAALPVAEAEPDNAVYQYDLAAGHERIGDAQSALGNAADALSSYQRAIAIIERLLAISSEQTSVKASLAIKLIRIGELQLAKGNFEDAESSFRRAMEYNGFVAAKDHDNAKIQREYAVSIYKMGELAAARGDDVTLGRDQRIERWRTAKSWFEKCREAFIDIRDRKLLWQSDAGVFALFESEIKRCEQSIAALDRFEAATKDNETERKSDADKDN